MLVSAAAGIFTCPSLRAVLHGAIDVAARPIVVQHSVRILEHSSVWVTDVLHPREENMRGIPLALLLSRVVVFRRKVFSENQQTQLFTWPLS